MKTIAPKTVLCIHDLPGFGRAALSVVVPILSNMGIQAVALPTAVLSTHTGGLGTPAKLSGAAYGTQALAHYRDLQLQFDCIYSGYLADASQAALVEQAMEYWPNALKIVDPVMGDNGRMYASIGEEMLAAMHKLCGQADVILPNLTEASLLLGKNASDGAAAGNAADCAEELTALCPQVILTGVVQENSIHCICAHRGCDAAVVSNPLLPRMFHGTGDIFGSVATGQLLRGHSLSESASSAAHFVAECIQATPPDADERLGVWLESVLPRLSSY